ncbi:MAG: hypothetical protein DA330_10805 [Nitrososphaera sp.]|nr:hypothetical protein [Nitrososphaera sp.]
MKFWKQERQQPQYFGSFGSDYNEQARAKPSSYVDSSYAGFDNIRQPEVAFATMYEYYKTIGRVQAAVDNYVAEILSRDWYFDGPESSVEAMEAWADEFDQADSRLIEYIVRDWLVCGNNIIGTTDWQPVNMASIVGLKRDDYGNVQEYVQSTGKHYWVKLPLKVDQYIHTKYIDINRQEWGIGMFHALATSFAWNGKSSIPQLELLRRHYQNAANAEERYAWPLNVWAFLSTNKEAFDKQQADMKAWKPGERRFFGVQSADQLPQIITETIDGNRSGLLKTTSEIIDQETSAGLQSSGTRLRTEPSAMADAREARKEDDVLLLGIMEKIRRVFNGEIIPRVLTSTNRTTEFKFGQKDQFDMTLADILAVSTAKVNNEPLISIKEGRNALQKIGFPLSDTDYNTFINDQRTQSQMQQDNIIQRMKLTRGQKPDEPATEKR